MEITAESVFIYIYIYILTQVWRAIKPGRPNIPKSSKNIKAQAKQKQCC
jgi:hypothetical protein